MAIHNQSNRPHNSTKATPLTFIAICKGILHNDRLPVQSAKQLRSGPTLPKTLTHGGSSSSILPASLALPSPGAAGRGGRRTRTQDVAREEVFGGGSKLGVGDIVGVAVPRGEEDVGGRDEQHVVRDGGALGGERAGEEGAEEGV